MKYAIVNKKNVVENIVEWDGKSKFKPDNGTLVKIEKQPVQIGWTYKDGKFADPDEKA